MEPDEKAGLCPAFLWVIDLLGWNRLFTAKA
jgi:hypothetical protein